ncbi:MAG: exonuclease SbcCD subunit D, partial [Anaerolineales bacterium]|nr:exonuclease SbcCD subunit D [Anaerolineales bacterium]
LKPMPKILHFADAHIDIANYGRRDPETGLPLRILDFLASLDEIINCAIKEEVDCVLFAGDAYKDRNPAPTFQREWGSRIMRLSQAGIPTILLVGNHDISPSIGRAHALTEFATLNVPHVLIVDKPCFLSSEELSRLCPEGKSLDLQLIALPWLSRTGMMTALDLQTRDLDLIYQEMTKKLTNDIDNWLKKADPQLPIVLAAHASVEGAVFGGERSVSLGNDLVLPLALVQDHRLDYTALGHLHKKQNLNKGKHPPVVYPGSIERIDFGEAKDDKYFVIAEVNQGKTKLDWHKLENIRPFVDQYLKLTSKDKITDQIKKTLPSSDLLKDAIIRLVLEYPRAWDPLIDESAIRELVKGSFEFHFVKQPQSKVRIRLPKDRVIGSLSPEELLDQYWKTSQTPEDEIESLNKLAQEIIHPNQDLE